MANYQELANLVWNVADDVLRGLFKPHEYGDITLPFLVLRRLDCILDEDDRKDKAIQTYKQFKDHVPEEALPPIILKEINASFYNTSQYDLSRLTEDPTNIHLNFENYLNGFSQDVRDIIENFNLDRFIERLNQNNRLFIFCDKFTEVDLHPNQVDNRTMGLVFEELLRKFSEMSNETSGEHYTPRDVVQLLVSLLFAEHRENLRGQGVIRSIFDPCCGTGGMLTIGKKYFREQINPNADIRLLGQELNAQTYAICKSDMLITGEDPDSIQHGSSLSNDRFQGQRFDYMITNPPFGVSWKSDEVAVKAEAQTANGRFSAGTPRSSDGALLFLQHMLSKMEARGSRVGIVFNGSPLFTGDAGSGESEIRRWIIENDYLECIIALPEKLFFNTSIATYIWILTNRKSEARRGKIQLINAVDFHDEMKRNLGAKNALISDNHIRQLIQLYTNFEETEHCKIYPNDFFGYTKVTVERPLIEKCEVLGEETEVVVRDKQGNPKPDSKLRDYERVPLTENIEDYYQREVKPHVPDSWIDRKRDKVGYEINFNRYFYQYTPLRSLKEIADEILALERKSEGLLNEVLGF
ncbi:SAM-dependent DNA methyltransferase [Candidatus Poribacteria bacterium]|nr:SAM-dependent DNA methyltransferase [Candidatus Poribacteria bacterium]MYG07723.1 SAM-dependent DNA methyltransferase [Candidatus Poribacteria bacterium]MYK23667.1 SAM-dependent DNA methyltransferase [Candidatus Poribacteria bacterium]